MDDEELSEAAPQAQQADLAAATRRRRLYVLAMSVAGVLVLAGLVLVAFVVVVAVGMSQWASNK